MIYQKEITLPSFGRGFHIITSIIRENMPEVPEKGLLNIFIKHTSAALTLNENADPSVRHDLDSAMREVITENPSHYTHTLEGSDDMPAHIKSSLFGQSLTIPISQGHLNVGTWQGIYLCEFRNRKHRRRLVLTVYT
ncbi:MAG: secondary thiamine-phosphate synthase enzyme YjbQ [Bacteroidales bacterium]|jgi:secondary thiamine-phosphate synthase enzyme|nr:secondary thiamine-phosphate synthase enzyme YjbQ [Bacteroidales bacterium]MBS3774787.1 secondary thiamine-phosphate synthase enzyme YjbQ [Bacteroidales bacterium]